jgi:hypothetical protein
MDVPRRKSFREERPTSTLHGRSCRGVPVRTFANSYGARTAFAFCALARSVISSSGKPVSAKQNLSSSRSRGLRFFRQLLGFAPLLLPLSSRAASLEDAAHELAMKVCLAARKQPVKVVWSESGWSSVYLSDARKRVFLDQISACGMEAAQNSDAPILIVTLQITPSKALLMANTTEALTGPQLYVVEVPRASLSVAREAAPAPQLRRELLWQQEKPIQSALEWQDPTTEERFLFLLSDSLFMRFCFENGAWKWMDSAQFLPAGRSSRAGEVSLFYSHAKERVELLLSKKVCDIDPTIHFSYSCTGTEVSDRTTELSPTCGESPRNLATGKGDFTQPDRITLASIAGAGVAASADDNYPGSLDMPGPVFDISVAKDSKSAAAVVKNLSTGNYEVYRITAVCSN